MTVPDRAPDTLGPCAVADPFALYRIATAHTPGAVAVRQAALSGRLRLLVPAVAFAVTCAMRTCWDEECGREHDPDAGGAAHGLHGRGGLELVDLAPEDALAAGRLYADCVARRIEGAEVLAACHTVLLTRSGALPRLTTARASYCYAALPAAPAHLL